MVNRAVPLRDRLRAARVAAKAEGRVEEWQVERRQGYLVVVKLPEGPRPATIDALIARWNEIGAMSHAERVALEALCLAAGGHQPSGEQFMTNPPIETCWRCGAEFHLKTIQPVPTVTP